MTIEVINMANLADEINSAIRQLSVLVKKAIVEKDYKTFSQMTQDMIITSKYAFKDYDIRISNIIKDTCHNLNDLEKKKNTELTLESVADFFYREMLNCTASYMN
jgi:hypothetical protein